MINDDIDISSISDVKEKIFKIFDEIRTLCVGFSILQDPKALERWEPLKDQYYQNIKSLILYELEWSKRLNNQKPNIQ